MLQAIVLIPQNRKSFSVAAPRAPAQSPLGGRNTVGNGLVSLVPSLPSCLEGL
jgi:hypothetical protein